MRLAVFYLVEEVMKTKMRRTRLASQFSASWGRLFSLNHLKS